MTLQFQQQRNDLAASSKRSKSSKNKKKKKQEKGQNNFLCLVGIDYKSIYASQYFQQNFQFCTLT